MHLAVIAVAKERRVLLNWIMLLILSKLLQLFFVVNDVFIERE
jgi:hypothetical protein